MIDSSLMLRPLVFGKPKQKREEEMKNNTITLKNMENGQQVVIQAEELIERFTKK